MILYMSTNLNSGLLDFIQDEALPIKKLIGEFALKKFVIRDMRSFSHIKFIVIDYTALKDTEEEIIEAVLGFRSMYDARIIFIAEGLKPGDEFLSKLYDAEVRNFVTAGEAPEEIQAEILECISLEGLSSIKAEQFKSRSIEEIKPKVKKAKPKTERIKPVKDEVSEPVSEKYEYVEGDQTVKLGLDNEKERKGQIITIGGVMNRAGTTTAALNLAYFLNRLGAKVAYIEGDNKKLAWLPFYEVIINEQTAEYKGVNYYNRSAKIDYSQFDFNILDIGVLSENSLKAFEFGEVKILCATSKPYEIKQTETALELIGASPVNLLFSFTADNDRPGVRQLINKHSDNQVFFSNYSPDLFEPNPNRMIWTKIMEEYLEAIPPEEQKKKRLRVS